MSSTITTFSQKLIMDKQELDKLLAKQKEFFNTSTTLDIDFRIKQLKLLKNLIKENENKIIEALKSDLGKSELEAYATEIGYVYDSISNMIKKLPRWSKRQKVPTPMSQFGSKSYIYKEPYGSVLIIGPFNYPFQLLIEPLIGALAAGNCAILKPSENTPAVSSIINEIIGNNFPANYINVVEGGLDETSLLISAPFDYIFFTGSVRVGKIVMEAAGRNLVPVTLELGGKSPCIVDESANLKLAAKRIVWGKLINAGQTCIAPDYLYVHKNIKDKFISLLKETIEDFYGTDAHKSKDFGRIVSEKHAQRLADIIEKDKAKVIYGGQYDIGDKYVGPTIIKDADYNDACMQDELFGPIIPVLEYESLGTLIDIINSKPKPLALYIFSENKSIIQNLLRRVSFGGGCVNDTISHVATHELPFGGVGNSGIGGYHGKYSFETFSHTKSVLDKPTWFEHGLTFPPYKNKVKMIRRVLK